MSDDTKQHSTVFVHPQQTIKACHEHIREWLTKHVRQTISPTQSLTWSSFVEWFANHPYWGARLSDLTAIRIVRHPKTHALLLQIRTTTNTRFRTISWKAVRPQLLPLTTPLTTPPPITPLATLPPCSPHHLYAACRHAVRRQILAYRRTHPRPSSCPLCGQHPRVYHVDHREPCFKHIFDTFLSTHADLAVPQSFSFRGKYCPRPTFKKPDQRFKSQWLKWHKQHATYQYLCGSCNSRKGTK